MDRQKAKEDKLAQSKVGHEGKGEDRTGVRVDVKWLKTIPKWTRDTELSALGDLQKKMGRKVVMKERVERKKTDLRAASIRRYFTGDGVRWLI